MDGQDDDESVVANLKLLVIGDSSTGKSSLLMRFVEDTFEEDRSPTIGVDFKARIIDVNGNKTKLTIWDTAGQERFRTLTASYYRGAHGIILVYDVSRRDTFQDIKMWLTEVGVYSTEENAIKMVIGNKIDLPREVTTEEGRSFAKDNNMLFIESSAKTKQGVEQAFEELTMKIIDTPSLWQKGDNSKGMRLGGGDGPLEGSACGC